MSQFFLQRKKNVSVAVFLLKQRLQLFYGGAKESARHNWEDLYLFLLMETRVSLLCSQERSPGRRSSIAQFVSCIPLLDKA